MYRKTYIEINTANLKDNVSTLITKYPGYGYYIGVAKGNVYGHGPSSAKALLEAGVNYLAVSTLDEALVLRKEGIVAPILLLQPIHIEDVPVASKNDITITLSNYDFFKKLIGLSLEKELKVHLKINSGFNRLGLSDSHQVKEIFDALREGRNFKLEGIYSHFMTSGRSDAHFDKQLSAFRQIVSFIDLKQIPIVHLDRSLTLQCHKKIDICTGVRIGIMMYGYGEISKIQKSFLSKIFNTQKFVLENSFLKPAFGLFGEIIEINKIKKGDSAGYGATFSAPKDGYVACVSFGYSDGFFQKNKGGDVSINGKRYKIISVDMSIVTIFVDEAVKTGDKVEFIGANISAKEVAFRCGVTVYEILCEFKESLPRVLI